MPSVPRGGARAAALRGAGRADAPAQLRRGQDDGRPAAHLPQRPLRPALRQIRRLQQNGASSFFVFVCCFFLVFVDQELQPPANGRHVPVRSVSLPFCVQRAGKYFLPSGKQPTREGRFKNVTIDLLIIRRKLGNYWTGNENG